MLLGRHGKSVLWGRAPFSRGRGTGSAGPQAQRPPPEGSAVHEVISVGASYSYAVNNFFTEQALRPVQQKTEGQYVGKPDFNAATDKRA